MFWERVSAQRFGPLMDWKGEIDQPLTVFLGRNEAGKTTLMELFTGLMFGYRGMKADRSRLIAWGARDAVISGDLLLPGGRRQTVVRTLKEDRAACEVQQNSVARDMGDAPLSALAGLDRNLYRNLYALTLNDLLFPEKAAWATITDRILGGQMADFLRPSSDVQEELLRRTQSVWRNDRRGSPQMKKLKEEHRELQQRLQEARARQEQLLRLTEQEQADRAALAGLTRRMADCQRQLAVTEQFLELAQDLAQVEQLEAQAGDMTVIDRLPQDIEAKLKQLSQGRVELLQGVGDLADKVAQANRVLDIFDEHHERALELAQDIRKAAGLSGLMAQDARQVPELGEQRAAAEREFETLSRSFLLETPSPDVLDEVLPASLKAATLTLQEAMTRHQKAQDRLERAREETHGTGKFTRPLGILGGILLVGGVAMLLPFFTLPDFARWAAVGAAGVGLVLFMAATSLHPPKAQEHLSALETAASEAAAEVETARQACKDALQGLKLPDGALLQPQDLLRQIDLLCTLKDKAQDLSHRQAALKERLENNRTWVLDLAARVLAQPPEDPQLAIEDMVALLEEARSLEARHAQALSERGDLQTRLQRQNELLQRTIEEEKRLQNMLSSTGVEGQARQIEQIQHRRALRSRAEALMDELRQRYPDLEAQRQQLRREGPEHCDEATRLALRQHLEELTQQQIDLHTRLGALSTQMDNLRDQPLPADVQADLDDLEEEMASLGRARDRDALALGVLRVAEKRFRENHQPDVIQAASGYLFQFTGGRYDRLMLTEDLKRVRVHSRVTDTYVDPDEARLSRGTLEQLYLALRLGLMDHLDPEDQTLPMFLDETLVNWDDERLSSGLEVLSTVAERRQVLLFTCHPYLPERLEKLGIPHRCIPLGAGS